MPLITTLPDITLSSADRFEISSKTFRYLRIIKIKNLVVLPISDISKVKMGDDGLRRLKSINPLTTELVINDLTIVSGGLDIQGASEITIDSIISTSMPGLH